MFEALRLEVALAPGTCVVLVVVSATADSWLVAADSYWPCSSGSVEFDLPSLVVVLPEVCYLVDHH